MKIKIRVTQKDIKEGKKLAEFDCPVSLAMQRTFKAECVEVSNMRADAFACGKGRKDLAFSLPQEARLFISKFDNDVEVKPFSFTLESEAI